MDRIDLPGVTVDFRNQQVRGSDGARIELRPHAFGVLRCLTARAGELVTKDELLTQCWPGVVVTEDSLTQCVSEIRRALGHEGRDLIRTVSRRGYTLTLPEAPNSQEATPCPRGLWPSVAVMPFDEFSGEAGQQVLGAGFAEDIITELARNRNLTVIARHSSFAAKAQGMTPAEIAAKFQVRYVLEGSIRRVAERVVVNAQLIDGRDSRHVWAERYAFSADALFATQDELVARIAAILFSEIRETEKAASLRRPPAHLDVYELAIKGLAHKHRLSRDDFIASRAALERAVALDPLYAPAQIYLGYVNAGDAGIALSGLLGGDALPEAIAAIRCGVALDPTLAIGHLALSFALTMTDAKHEALRAAERSVALGPGDADNIIYLGYALANIGRCEEALRMIERAMALNPIYPGFYSSMAAFALYPLGRFEEGLAHARQTVDRVPGLNTGYTTTAMMLMALGRKDEAAASIAAVVRRSPRFTLRTPILATSYIIDPAVQARALQALRDAGLPEG